MNDNATATGIALVALAVCGWVALSPNDSETRAEARLDQTIAKVRQEFAAQSLPPQQPPASTHEGEPAAGVGFVSWDVARAESLRTGRPVLVFQHFADPEQHRACKPCQYLEKTLSWQPTRERLAELGILCEATAEEWQRGDNVTAPAIAYVPAEHNEGDAVPKLTGFETRDADELLTDLKEWIDAL